MIVIAKNQGRAGEGQSSLRRLDDFKNQASERENQEPEGVLPVPGSSFRVPGLAV